MSARSSNPRQSRRGKLARRRQLRRYRKDHPGVEHPAHRPFDPWKGHDDDRY